VKWRVPSRPSSALPLGTQSAPCVEPVVNGAAIAAIALERAGTVITDELMWVLIAVQVDVMCCHRHHRNSDR
jgi:hypothetical protein